MRWWLQTYNGVPERRFAPGVGGLMHFGFAVQPDNNIGGASNERIIVHFLGLPFVRERGRAHDIGRRPLGMDGGRVSAIPSKGRPLQLRHADGQPISRGRSTRAGSSTR